ncbi:MAG: sugar phosphate nucleotidyltransferase, partial [Verrucomicrobiota bacterium]
MDLDLPMDHRNRKADACTLAGSPLLSAVENAFVLGAGFGTRLRPLTLVQPKPLIPLLNKPLISYAFDQLQAVGAKRFLVNTHHLAERYEEAFPSLSYQDTPITLVREEPEILDTGGGIANIASEVQGDSFWVFNGDIFTDLPLAPAMSLHREKGHWVTLLLRSSGPNPNVNWSPETGLVSDLRNARNTNGTALYQFTGIYLVHPAFLRYLKPEPESVVPAFLRLIEEENALGGALIDEGRWWDLGNRDAYLDATHALLSSPGDFQPGPRIHPTAHLADSAKIDDSSVIGAHCRVGDEVTLESSILWPHAQIHPGASLSRCILTGKHHPIIGEYRDTDFEDPLDQQTLLELTHRKLPNLSGIDFKAERIARGGSDRQYFRLRPAIQSLIFCQYEERTPEDSRFARHTDFLGEQGVPVPRIFARDIEARRLWIEDLGSQDLWSFREADWNVIRRPLYEASIL